MYSTHNVRPIPPISWSVEAEPPKVIVIALQCARQTKPNKNRVSQNTGAYSKSTSLANTNIRWDGQRIHRSPPANSISISIKQKPNELVLWLPETDGFFNRTAWMAKWGVRLSCNCRAGGLIKRSARADLCGSSKRSGLIQSGYWVASRPTGGSHLSRSAFCILGKHFWATDLQITQCPNVPMSNP